MYGVVNRICEFKYDMQNNSHEIDADLSLTY